MKAKKLVSLVLAVLMLVSVMAIAPANAAGTDAGTGDWYLWGSLVDAKGNATDFGVEEDWDKPTAYEFENNKLTTTFETDAYIGVKQLSTNSWFMTDGWLGQVKSATLYNSDTDTHTFEGKKDKLFVPGGVEVTITMKHNLSADSVSLTLDYEGEEQPATQATGDDVWYLWGSFVDADEVATDWGNTKTDWDKPTDYGFENGTLTATFTENTYVGVKNLKTNSWYMTDGWVGEVTEATLYNADTYTFTGDPEDPDRSFLL